MSGWSTSRTTIFAARRVLPPDLIVPADASAPRMNDTGPGGVAALRQLLLRGAQLREVDAGARAAAEDDALAPDPVEDRLHRVVDREDEARRALRLLLEADVEPDRRVEGGELVHEDELQLVLERLRLLVAREVAARAAPRADRVDDAADHLLDAALAVGRAHAAAEVLLRDDVRRRLRPELRELDALLLEGRLVLAGDEGVARLPLDLVERVASGDREVAANAELRAVVEDGVQRLFGLAVRWSPASRRRSPSCSLQASFPSQCGVRRLVPGAGWNRPTARPGAAEAACGAPACAG